MNPDLQALLDHRHHVVTHRQAHDVGIGPEELRQHVARGDVTRLARGAYADSTAFAGADDQARHVLRCRAVLATLPDAVALSHHSAAAVWSMPWLGGFPDRVHVIRSEDGHHRRSASHTIHPPVSGTSTTRVDGLPVVEPAYALLGVAAHHGFRQTVVALDAARRTHLVSEADLDAVVEEATGRSGRGVLQAAQAACDPHAESPGESLTRLLLRDLGYAVRSQVEVRASHPSFRARVDFLLQSHRVVIEFDGMVKYGSARGTADRAALVREKVREDRLRSLGFEVVRLVWADLYAPGRVRGLIEDACRRAARRPVKP